MASVYMLRAFIRTMHNRVGPSGRVAGAIGSRDALVLAPLVLAILAFALYPQAALDAASSRPRGPSTPRSAQAGRRWLP